MCRAGHAAQAALYARVAAAVARAGIVDAATADEVTDSLMASLNWTSAASTGALRAVKNLEDLKKLRRVAAAEHAATGTAGGERCVGLLFSHFFLGAGIACCQAWGQGTLASHCGCDTH